MAQVSKSPIETKIRQELNEQFFWLIANLRQANKVKSFFTEFLTKTERKILVKRLAIALLLIKNYSYREIAKILKVSFPTIRNVSFWLDYGAGEYQKAVFKLSEKKETKNLLERVRQIAEKDN